MTHKETARKQTARRRKSATVRLLDDAVATPNRRAFMRLMAAQGASVPAAYFMLGSNTGTAAATPTPVAESTTGLRRKGSIRPQANVAVTDSPIIRDFAHPRIELIRLLREASEVEHALMIQYLYCAFSVKPVYQDVVGYGDPNTNDILGVAVEEMQHLAAVNRLLVALGAAPNLERQDFPYEPDIYPFEFNLEPLSVKTAAKHMYTEAPPGAFDRTKATSGAARAFLDRTDATIGPRNRPNQIGSFYRVVIDTLKEVVALPDEASRKLAPWVPALEEIMREGEEGHFVLFKDVFMGTHKGFNGHPDVWSLPTSNPAYPAWPLAVTPSAYVGHPRQIEDPTALSLAWLSNLHYWLALSFLAYSYRYEVPEFAELAKAQMIGPLWSLGRHLPTLGVGLPFDPLSMGYTLGKDRKATLTFFVDLLSEADSLAQLLRSRVPPDYPMFVNREMRDDVEKMVLAQAA